MELDRSYYKIEERLRGIKSKFDNTGFSLSNIVMAIFLIVIIIFVLINVSNVYIRGKHNLALIEEEKVKLDKLKFDETALKSDIDFYKSSRFVESYARDNLGLGRDGESLYRFNTNPNKIYELDIKNTDPILLDENKYWWKAIFLW